MKVIDVTADVSHPDRSRPLNDEQPQNMLSMLSTLDVSQPARLMDVSAEQY
jgi:hypothetical protein